MPARLPDEMTTSRSDFYCRRRELLGFTAAAFCTTLSAGGWANSPASNSPATWPSALPALRYRLVSHQPIFAATLAGTRVVAVGPRGVVICSDAEGGYVQAQVPVSADLLAVDFIDTRQGWAVGSDGVVIATQDGGLHWELQRSNFGADESLFGVRFFSAREGLAIGSFGTALATMDGGRTWVAQVLDGARSDAPHLYQVLTGPDASIVVAGESGALYRREPDAAWHKLDSAVSTSLCGGISFDSTLLLVGTLGAVILSTDEGLKWQRIAIKGTVTLSGVVRGPRDQLLLFGSRGAAFQSVDGGRSFAAVDLGTSSTITAAVWPKNDLRPTLFSLEGVVPSKTTPLGLAPVSAR